MKIRTQNLLFYMNVKFCSHRRRKHEGVWKLGHNVWLSATVKLQAFWWQNSERRKKTFYITNFFQQQTFRAEKNIFSVHEVLSFSELWIWRLLSRLCFRAAHRWHCWSCCMRQADLSAARFRRLAWLDAQMQESAFTGCHTLFKWNQHDRSASILSHYDLKNWTLFRRHLQ